MPIIQQLPTHLANLIAAGEVVERPASVVKELVENAIDAGAKKITVELRNGGMTFLRITDDGCGMGLQDARTAFLRHATSKIRTQEDLAAIGTLGFRGEALAAIASVSRIDLLTKEPGALSGVSLHLEAGVITEESEAGCPEGTTIIVRDLFYNVPARMKFMKQDSVEGGAASGTVQRQALAHPEVSIRLIRDGKELLHTPGDGKLLSAVAGVYGREAYRFISADSTWEKNRVWGYVSLPTESKASRTWQMFFVNGRPVKSRLLQSALEEAYRNQIMVGKFPACVLHLELPCSRVDVNVHPAKTEVKFLAEREIFDCIHYGVLAALNKTPDRPEVQLGRQTPSAPQGAHPKAPSRAPDPAGTFRTMTTQEFRSFAQAMEQAPMPQLEPARKTLESMMVTFRDSQPAPVMQVPVASPVPPAPPRQSVPKVLHSPGLATPEPFGMPVPEKPAPEPAPDREAGPTPAPEPPEEEAPLQTRMPLPQQESWRLVGELFHSYIMVEEGQDLFLIDKHAAHERILFDRLRAQDHQVTAQTLLVSQVCRVGQEAAAVLLEQQPLLEELGYGIEGFGPGVVLLRQVPMDLSPEEGAACLEQLAQDLLTGRKEDRDSLRDHILHTTACKAAIKAGWHTDPQELQALVRQVMTNQDLKYCPHGRPICIRLTKKQLERQFGRS